MLYQIISNMHIQTSTFFDENDIVYLCIFTFNQYKPLTPTSKPCIIQPS